MAQRRVPDTEMWAVGGDLGVFLPTEDGLDNALELQAFAEYYFTPRASLRTGFGWTEPPSRDARTMGCASHGSRSTFYIIGNEASCTRSSAPVWVHTFFGSSRTVSRSAIRDRRPVSISAVGLSPSRRGR
jgi:hypothetical protein